ncbi:MAG: hypothetical protein HN704_02195 [Bacteroidetes bacterium]|jgi:hypothetical protein|nr:hypothetical protein [Bacteroidota bacterium]MBT6687337.1 hypothetical protein [Bacteroidota bacterium]MBT7144629.1 hypothetical protein [Bacteroidota bacterium]MBT7490397.1 hypothetical protein [Bacteroidota bacterium]
MKRVNFLIVVFLGASLIWGNASAQTSKTENEKKSDVVTNQTERGSFVDTDKDGICDNFQEKGKTRKGRNFVDKDGNGVCDNSKDGNSKGFGKGKGNNKCYRNGKGKGQGMGKGNSRRNGRCRNN